MWGEKPSNVVRLNNQSGMLEKFKFSWRLTAHRHSSGGLKNPSPHERPLNSLLSMLNNCGRPSMGLYNFLDDQEDGYENVWECLDFPPKPEYELGQGVSPVWWLNIWVAYFFNILQSSLTGWVSLLLYSLQPVTFPSPTSNARRT